MEAFFTVLANKVLSEAGLVAALLALALWWVIKEWSAERKAHSETINKALTVTVDQIKASSATTEALNKLSSSIERLSYQRGGQA